MSDAETRGGDDRQGVRQAPWYTELQDPEWLHHQYVVEGHSPIAIADELGCRVPHVMRWIGRHALDSMDKTKTEQRHLRHR